MSQSPDLPAVVRDPWIADLVDSTTAAVAERLDDRTAAVFRRCFADTLEATMTPHARRHRVHAHRRHPRHVAARLERRSSRRTSTSRTTTPGWPTCSSRSTAGSSSDLRTTPTRTRSTPSPTGAGHHDDLTDSSPLHLGAQVRDRLALLPAPARGRHPPGDRAPRPPRRALRRRRRRGDRRLAHRAAPRGPLVVPVPAARRPAHRHARPRRTRIADGPPPASPGRRSARATTRCASATTCRATPSPRRCSATSSRIAADVLDDDCPRGRGRAPSAPRSSSGLRTHGVMTTDQHGDVYAYEVDGLGNATPHGRRERAEPALAAAASAGAPPTTRSTSRPASSC